MHGRYVGETVKIKNVYGEEVSRSTHAGRHCAPGLEPVAHWKARVCFRVVTQVHVRHGHGTYTYANKCFQYTGDWVCGAKHGQGVFTIGSDLDGTVAHMPADAPAAGVHSVYEGAFVNGEMTGTGLKRWRDGCSYSGQFLRGEPHGEGVWHGGDGLQYEGAFSHNSRSGRGTLSDAHGEHQGEFYRGKKHGPGHMKWFDEQAEHQGEWVRRCKS